MDQSHSTIVDCACGRRYMRHALTLTVAEASDFRCTCGDVVASWNGVQRFVFEPEDPPLPN